MTRGERTPRPLEGRRVLVTGDESRTLDLGRRVAARGADVVRMPVMTVEDPADGGAALAAAADRLAGGAYGWVVVTSANAVERLRGALAGRPIPSSTHGAAVGPSTGRALERAGLPCDLLPPEATVDGLASAFLERAGPGRVLYPRAEHVRGDLASRLRDGGRSVDDVVAYRTVGADPGRSVHDAARRADAVLFTSGSAVEHTVATLGVEGVPPLVVTIGPSTSAAVRDAGLAVSMEAVPHTTDGILDALVAVASTARPA